jgi:flagellar basal body-associated protein FliL
LEAAIAESGNSGGDDTTEGALEALKVAGLGSTTVVVLVVVLVVVVIVVLAAVVLLGLRKKKRTSAQVQ